MKYNTMLDTIQLNLDLSFCNKEKITISDNFSSFTYYVYKSSQDSFYKYPSVTSVLSFAEDKTYLKKWRESVGEKEANRITKKASSRGSAVHAMCEAYFLNKQKPSLVAEEINYFNQLQKILPKVKPKLLEQKVYWYDSNDISKGYAGTLDILLETDLIDSTNYNYIADFKTWSKPVYSTNLVKYYLQLAAYAGAVNNLTNNFYRINRGLVIGCTEKKLYVYYISPEKMKFYWETFLEILHNYYTQTSFNWNNLLSTIKSSDKSLLGELVNI